MSAATKKRIVAVDCMTLIWGIRRQGQREKIEHAEILFDELEKDEATIIVPAVVVAEYLVAVPTAKREDTVAAVSKRFQIEPFDVRDAVLAAQLWNYGKSHRQMAKEGSRICLRADTLIIATAKNRGAKEFFTDDKACLDMANQVMAAKHLPTVKPTLFPD